MKAKLNLVKTKFSQKIIDFRKYKPFNFIYLIVEDVFNFRIFDISAEAAYFFILSFFPFLFLLISLISFLPINFEPIFHNIQEYIPNYLLPIFGKNFNPFFDNASKSSISIGLIILLFSSSSATNLIIKNLNIIYESEMTHGSLLYRIWSLFINFIIILFIFSILIVAISARDVLGVVNSFITFDFHFIINFIQFLIIPLFINVIVLVVHRFSVPKKMKFKDIYIGSIISSFGLTITLLCFNFYLSKFNHYAIYGLIGAFIILLLYFYITAFIVLIGAIINRVIIQIKN